MNIERAFVQKLNPEYYNEGNYVIEETNGVVKIYNKDGEINDVNILKRIIFDQDKPIPPQFLKLDFQTALFIIYDLTKDGIPVMCPDDSVISVSGEYEESQAFIPEDAITNAKIDDDVFRVTLFIRKSK